MAVVCELDDQGGARHFNLGEATGKTFLKRPVSLSEKGLHHIVSHMITFRLRGFAGSLFLERLH